ncbi:MAG TPA: carboxypeptidase regulatory-like domain-containing protein [Planctomycetota bacterium]|nr:carboxypeptidase regulatory-like domain-containing protein [Planctomycetota bacterium]
MTRSRGAALGIAALLAAAVAFVAVRDLGEGRPEASAAPPESAAHAEAAAASPFESADATSRSSAAAAAPAPGASLRGRVVLEDTSDPVANATVALRCKDRRVDSPETWARLAKEADFASLPPPDVELRAVRAGGWRAARTTRTRDDGSFEIAAPPATADFRFEVSAPFVCDLRRERIAIDAREPVVLVVKPAGRIEGVVLDASGSPVADAVVVARPDPRWDSLPIDSLPPVRADASGAFAFDGILPGNWTISASTDDGPAGSIEIDVAPRRATKCAVRFEEGATVVGRVVDESGRGIDGATVRVGPTEGTWRDRTIHLTGGARTLSRADGSFRLTGLPTTKVWVGASKSGMRGGGKPDPIVLTDGAETAVELVLTRGEALSGIVVNASGEPQAGFVVGVSSPQLGAEQRAVTDADGRFSVGGLSPGAHDVRVRRDQRLVAFERLDASRPAAEPLRLVLATGAVSGHVRAASGEPVSRFRVTVGMSVRTSSSLIFEPVANERFVSSAGAFTIGELPPCELNLTVSADGFAAGSAAVSVAAGAASYDVAVELGPAATQRVTGRVVDGATGEPVRGAAVAFTGGFGWTADWSWTDESGGFEKRVWPAPELHLRVEHERYPSVLEPVEIPEGEALVIRLPIAGSIEGTLVFGGRALAGARVNAWRSSLRRNGYAVSSFDGFLQAREANDGGPGGRSATADENGRFRIDGLSPGPTRVAIGRVPPRLQSLAGAFRREVDVEVVAGDVVVAELARDLKGCTVHGRALHRGEPIAGARVWLSAGEGWSAGEVRTDAAGRYQVAGIAPGARRIAVDVGIGPFDERYSVDVDVPDAPEAAIDLVAPAGGIEGRLRRASDDAPVANAQLRLHADDETYRHASTDASGSFRFRFLPKGAYDLTIDAPDGSGLKKVERRGIDVGESDSTRVELALGGGAVAIVRVRFDDGAPAAGVHVYLQQVDADEGALRYSPAATSDAEGRARVSGAVPGRHVAVGWYGEQKILSEAGDVTLEREAAFEITIPRRVSK